jgi:sugar lactone lactonase YvrE
LAIVSTDLDETPRPRCVAETRDRLGEGPFWHAGEGRLYWFDIKNRKLNWYAHDSGEHGRFDLPLRASAGAPRAGGGFLLLTEAGLCNFDPASGLMKIRHASEATPGFRSNEGMIDVAGRFWWSVMDDDSGKRPGYVERYDPGGRSERVVHEISIPNTLACSPDGRTFYYADSGRRALYACDLDPETGAIGPPRPFAHTHGEPGVPDGTAVDADGYLWNAQWGGWRIVRYAPDGRVDRIVEMPVAQPTSCAFGGPDLRTLYVTSARDELSDAALEGQPLAGGLFAFEPGVVGLELPHFAD